ncbi:MAG TPA: hypothetical protein VJR29_00335 [bacterium]|nr:hypothetical protein [bacterium]
MLPYIIGAGAILGLAVAGCSSEEETPEQLEQKIIGKDLIESTERRVRAMENAENQSKVQVGFECDKSLYFQSYLNLKCDEQHQNFFNWTHRNYAKRFDVSCYSYSGQRWWNDYGGESDTARCEISKRK